MNPELKDFIKKQYTESCNLKNRNIKQTESMITWFFNRLDYFPEYLNYCKGNYRYPEYVKKIDIYYACANSGIDYLYISGLIDNWIINNPDKKVYQD
jgi:hypothetical protein